MVEDEILKEVELSKASASVTISLKRIVLTIVQTALIKHYGSNYSVRCLQSSFAIQKLLNEFGIKTVMVEGATCFIQVSGQNPYNVIWGGFWDKDHHLWLVSEYGEIIDFTISQLHMHSASIQNQYNPIPAVWLSPSDVCPRCFRYLPNSFPVIPKLAKEEEKDFQLFLDVFESTKQEILNSEHITPYTNFILEGLESLGSLLKHKDHWAMGAYIADQQKIPFPNWIINREAELLNVS